MRTRKYTTTLAATWLLLVLVLSSSKNNNLLAFSFVLVGRGASRILPVSWVEAGSTPNNEMVLLLPDLFPSLQGAIASLGFSTATPIQAASAERALAGENLLLIAPTGSGKTLAYLLPAITQAQNQDGTIVLIAPTRELAVQLRRDSLAVLTGLLSVDDDDDDDDGNNHAESLVQLAVKGMELPSQEELLVATLLIGTPPEVYETLERWGLDFIAGDTLSAIILDEVDVLLPPTPKNMRTTFDSTTTTTAAAAAKHNHQQRQRTTTKNAAQEERKKREQKRKLRAALRRGLPMDTEDRRVVSDTERILGLIASRRLVVVGGGGGDPNSNYRPPPPPLVLAGSATASRKALDRLNKALRSTANRASIPFEVAWSTDVQTCRPHESNNNENNKEAVHTIRSVTVPQEVDHRYIELSNEDASSAKHVLSAVAKAASQLQPETALVFLCGEFGKPNLQEKNIPRPPIRGATSKARRNALMKQKQNALRKQQQQQQQSKLKQQPPPGGRLSARKACELLHSLGMENAQPLHVALGLEGNQQDTTTTTTTTTSSIPPVLVTFEGSARGLHFDAVDAVFVVGRPSSAAAYMHLAGRVGRSSADAEGNIVIRPGTVVSVCTKGSAGELQKWTQQIGGTELQPFTLL